jgi:subtilisin-like proprotein convertase family protein
LVIELSGPAGATALLHNRQGSSQDNLIQTYDSASVQALAALVGQPVQGNWVLRVRDVAGQDIGKFNRWSIEIALDVGSQTVRGEVAPQLPIPDNDAVGISSSLTFNQPGTVRQLKLSLDLAHTYVGDLRVELLSPTGRRALLHSQTGGSQDDLVLTYDSTLPSSPLAPLVGQPVQGIWVLRVADVVGQDVGTLKKWGLELTAGQ